MDEAVKCDCGKFFVSAEKREAHRAKDHPALNAAVEALDAARKRLCWQLRIGVFVQKWHGAAVLYDTLMISAEEGTLAIDGSMVTRVLCGQETFRSATEATICRRPPKHRGRHKMRSIPTRPGPEDNPDYTPSERAAAFAAECVPIEEHLPFFVQGEAMLRLRDE